MKKGQVIKAETDSVVSMSEHVSLGSTVDGGVFSGLARSMLSGETFFMQVRGDRPMAQSMSGHVHQQVIRNSGGLRR